MLDTFTFADLYTFASNLFDALLSVQDFFFKPRSFELNFSPVTDFLLEKLGISLTVWDGSVASFIIGFGLPTFLGFRLLKFIVDIVL